MQIEPSNLSPFEQTFVDHAHNNYIYCLLHHETEQMGCLVDDKHEFKPSQKHMNLTCKLPHCTNMSLSISAMGHRHQTGHKPHIGFYCITLSYVFVLSL